MHFGARLPFDSSSGDGYTAVAGMNWGQEVPADFRATLTPPTDYKKYTVKEMMAVSKCSHGVLTWRHLEQTYQEKRSTLILTKRTHCRRN
ncbi:hypothetical protein PoB_002974000 [Plakobranchus ocellatus]|uniref:Uncharacterized protein n=1 Tax=Plakobranchus ocellatus TaxID=259542 RepID=A0AAV4A514_9GAST|nr:hypothetical protein PoB_002974000 [Plakobranchus ocellatus]